MPSGALPAHEVSFAKPCFTRKCDLDVNRLFYFEDEIAKQIAGALNRPLRLPEVQRRPRHSKDPLAYAEFMRGYRLSSSGDPALLDDAAQHLINAVTRDPAFALAHATLSFVCATRHFEFDPAGLWLEKAEFHCRRCAGSGFGFARRTRRQCFSVMGTLQELSASCSNCRTEADTRSAE